MNLCSRLLMVVGLLVQPALPALCEMCVVMNSCGAATSADRDAGGSGQRMSCCAAESDLPECCRSASSCCDDSESPASNLPDTSIPTPPACDGCTDCSDCLCCALPQMPPAQSSTPRLTPERSVESYQAPVDGALTAVSTQAGLEANHNDHPPPTNSARQSTLCIWLD